ncbi:hypothetical protein CBS101457_006935 [Exobasidium rhododendri]|nr:hypothetical protein CBS101457_006935 [Exobasidium rhododendri]
MDANAHSTLNEKDSHSDLSPVNEKGEGEYVRSEVDVAETGEKQELRRALTPAQISMIAIGGSIGTGLILGTGTALFQGGPAGLLIGYIVMGWVCFQVLSGMGEMSSYIPSKEGFAGYATRFVDPAAGMATGYTYLFKYLIVTPNQLNASALLISYWRPDLSGAIFVSVFFVFILLSNLCGVRWFGLFEYGMSAAKILILTAIILGGFIISMGGSPSGDRIGFRYWKDGHAFKEYKEGGALGRFLGTWSVLTLALFAYMGSELVGVCAGEASNPRKSIPSAIKKTVWRIIFFYIFGVLVIGMLVRADDPRLTSVKGSLKSTAAASPFVLAIESAGIKALPGIVNGALLVFTISAANSDLYIASRTLYGLAADGKAPRIFLRCNRLGVPYVALGVSSLFCALAYLNVSSGGTQTFSYLTSTVTIFGGLVWFSILLSHIRFMAGLKAQNISRSTLPYQSPFQPYSSYIAISITVLVLFFKGFNVFWPTFDYKSFITNYIGIPVYIAMWVGWKVVKKSSWIKASEMDFSEALKYDILDEEEEVPRWKKTLARFRKNRNVYPAET